MPPFAHDTIKPYKKNKEEKKQQIADMFDSVAFRYDFLNRFLSLGIDKGWRKKAIKRLDNLNVQNVLDVATGTGDVAIMMGKLLKPQKITGIDISVGMLKIAAEKVENAGLGDMITLMSGDSEALPFEENVFDAITVAFGVRNFENLKIGISELYRVLRPGGKLIIQEFSQPKNKIFKVLYKFYMNIVTPRVGRMVSKNKDAYQYLNESIKAFPERDHFVEVLNNAGFVNTSYTPLSLGICCIYEGVK